MNGRPTNPDPAERITRREVLERRLKKNLVGTLVEYLDCADVMAKKMDCVSNKLDALTVEAQNMRADLRQHMVEAHHITPHTPPPPSNIRAIIIQQRYALLIAIVASITTFITTVITVHGV
jgi:hypothetical protein